MKDHERMFDLSRNIEKYLAALSKLYAQKGEQQLQAIIVNGKVRVHEEWSYDNWNGGQYGHALYLDIPETLFLQVVGEKDKIEKQIVDDINSIHNVHAEFIDAVFLEMEIEDNINWRIDSGLLITNRRTVDPKTEKRIWREDGFRVFLSHKAEVKKETASLKKDLKLFGVESFVAHEDIHPTKEWQEEIENALSSMDAFVALMTEDFHDSYWTDQEVGYAFGRGVPIVSIKLGKDPYGFIGKFQALSCSWETSAKEVVKIFIKYDGMVNSYIKALRSCGSFDDANTLSEILPFIMHLSDQQVGDIISAHNENSQVRSSYGFNGLSQGKYGKGLAYHLYRLTGYEYQMNRYDGKISIS